MQRRMGGGQPQAHTDRAQGGGEKFAKDDSREKAEGMVGRHEQTLHQIHVPSTAKYHCPGCGEQFRKWGLCLSHLRMSQHVETKSMNGVQQYCMLRPPKRAHQS